MILIPEGEDKASFDFVTFIRLGFRDDCEDRR